MRTIAPVAYAEAGGIRIAPKSLIGKIIASPISGLSMFIPPVTYILCVTFNRFVQPAWMQRMSLPTNTYFNHEIEVGLRVAACAATFVLLRVTARTMTLLGNQWHAIGVRTDLFLSMRTKHKITTSRQRREKSRLVQTGAYAVVRHPGYA